ncbi:uncharacterized protein PV09_03855 [Verruconis gallopava]|uniref:Uncharacterized protein n=1 Tax=Verruconis gallopava TaxID=253628 RepID=A0A0D1XRL8_9PEZI|nr:uncharacterized protein PV09_03855 [Verruconis gallopava]KIW05336.1 hypothetical protein PV09_03855 [Verruconis gallopava]
MDNESLNLISSDYDEYNDYNDYNEEVSYIQPSLIYNPGGPPGASPYAHSALLYPINQYPNHFIHSVRATPIGPQLSGTDLHQTNMQDSVTSNTPATPIQNRYTSWRPNGLHSSPLVATSSLHAQASTKRHFMTPDGGSKSKKRKYSFDGVFLPSMNENTETTGLHTQFSEPSAFGYSASKKTISAEGSTTILEGSTSNHEGKAIDDEGKSADGKVYGAIKNEYAGSSKASGATNDLSTTFEGPDQDSNMNLIILETRDPSLRATPVDYTITIPSYIKSKAGKYTAVAFKKAYPTSSEKWANDELLAKYADSLRVKPLLRNDKGIPGTDEEKQALAKKIYDAIVDFRHFYGATSGAVERLIMGGFPASYIQKRSIDVVDELVKYHNEGLIVLDYVDPNISNHTGKPLRTNERNDTCEERIKNMLESLRFCKSIAIDVLLGRESLATALILAPKGRLVAKLTYKESNDGRKYHKKELERVAKEVGEQWKENTRAEAEEKEDIQEEDSEG